MKNTVPKCMGIVQCMKLPSQTLLRWIEQLMSPDNQVAEVGEIIVFLKVADEFEIRKFSVAME